MKENVYKTLGTSVIYSSMSPSRVLADFYRINKHIHQQKYTKLITNFLKEKKIMVGIVNISQNSYYFSYLF